MKSDIKWKIWLVVCILLVSIVINGLVGYMLDRKNINRLDNISHSVFPAAQSSSLALECFKSQLRLYEDAVMTGEWNLLEKAWEEQKKIEKALKVILTDPLISEPRRKGVSSLLNNFLEFSIAADYVYGMMDEGNPEKLEKAEKIVPELSRRKEALLNIFTKMSDDMSANLHNEIDQINSDTRKYNYAMMLFSSFVILVVLITTAFIVNMAIIRPVNAVFDELTAAQKDKELEAQLYQRQKLESLGELSAGVAHEINNPVGYIGANIVAMQDYAKIFQDVLNIAKAMEVAATDEVVKLVSQIKSIDEREDLKFIIKDVGRLLDECIDGTERVTEIVSNLKSFARPDAREMVKYNVIDGLESTLKILHNELKYKCNITEDFSEQIPPIICHPGEINQVFINLISNAVQAIQGRGDINIKVWSDGEYVYVEISDTGCGIAPENVKQIFDPFYTTKPHGKGTGLGLSVSHGIINKHEGKIAVVSEVGKGSVFTIILPVISAGARNVYLSNEEDNILQA